MLVIPNISELEMLKRIVAYNTTPSTIIVGLYTNDYTPAETDIISNYIEPQSSSYSQKTLNTTDWVISEYDDNGTIKSRAVYPTIDFIITATTNPISIYGYFGYTYDILGNQILMFAERFTNGPYIVTSNSSATISINVGLQLE